MEETNQNISVHHQKNIIFKTVMHNKLYCKLKSKREMRYWLENVVVFGYENWVYVRFGYLIGSLCCLSPYCWPHQTFPRADTATKKMFIITIRRTTTLFFVQKGFIKMCKFCLGNNICKVTFQKCSATYRICYMFAKVLG